MYLGVIAILPGMINLKPDMTKARQFFGGIFVNNGWAVLDTLQQIESHLLMRHYDGLMEKEKLKVNLLKYDVMIHYRSEDEIDLTRESLYLLLIPWDIADKPGLPHSSDKIAEDFIRDNGGIPI